MFLLQNGCILLLKCQQAVIVRSYRSPTLAYVILLRYCSGPAPLAPQDLQFMRQGALLPFSTKLQGERN